MASNITPNKSESSSVADLLANAPGSVTDLLKAHLPGNKDDEKSTPDSAESCSVHRSGTEPTKDLYRQMSKDELDNSSKGAAEPSRQMSKSEEGDYPAAFRLAMIIVALALSIFLVAIDMTIVATAIPRITDQFHSLDQVGWYGSAFFLTLASFQSTWGKAYKYFPLKTSFLISILIFEIGSLVCAVAKNSTTLIVGRAIAGAGGAGIASGAYTIIAFSAPPQQRPAFTGILGASYGIASVIGPHLGGVFTDKLTWRWCFYINLPIGAVSMVVIATFFKTPKAAKPQKASPLEKILQMDLPGTFVIMAAVVCYLLAFQWGGTTKPWNSGSVIGTLVAFGVLVVIFVAIEWYSGDRALLQFRLLKDRTIGVMCAYVVAIAATFFIAIYYLPIYFQSTRNVSASKSGIDNLPLMLAATIFTITSGVLITAFGHYIPLMIIGSAVSAVGAGLIYTLDIHSPSSKWIPYQAVLGIGVGLSLQIPVIVNQSIVGPSDMSSVSAMTLFFQTIGGSLFISAGQAAFVNRLLSRVSVTAPGVNPALVVATGATDLRKVFSAHDLPGIIVAYLDGLRVAFAITIATACLGFILAFAPRWQKLNGKEVTPAAV